MAIELYVSWWVLNGGCGKLNDVYKFLEIELDLEMTTPRSIQFIHPRLTTTTTTFLGHVNNANGPSSVVYTQRSCAVTTDPILGTSALTKMKQFRSGQTRPDHFESCINISDKMSSYSLILLLLLSQSSVTCHVKIPSPHSHAWRECYL